MGLVSDLHFLIISQPSINKLQELDTYPSQRTQLWTLLFEKKYSHQRSFLLLSALLFALTCYILLPSYQSRSQTQGKMFSKRPDKYTTGLINMRNDCFANSSIQAYSSLPGLTDYLNKFIGAHRELQKLIDSHKVDLNEIVTLKDINVVSQIKFKLKSDGETKAENSDIKKHFTITLHEALAKIIRKLQETQMTSRTISVWTFLHVLERIYDAKISKSQHDAHELTQLINETLENENVNCIKILKKMKQYYSTDKSILTDLDKIEFQEFPFSGLILSQMKCLTCSFVSRPHFSPFLMLTLHPPQARSTELETLLDENESETISEYQCLKCRVLRLVACEDLAMKSGSENTPTDQEKIDKLTALNKDDHLFINEDLSPELDKFLKTYNKHGVEIAKVTSTVYRRTNILKPPKVFGVHLSRSSFNGVTISRNPCRVSFNDKLTLSIGTEYLEELKKFQNSAETTELSHPHIKVLTTDVNDMEDENVQREDIDQKGNEDEELLEEAEVLSTATEGESQTLDDSDTESTVSDQTAPPSISTANTTRTVDGKGDTLNNAPISQDQTVSLQGHFRKFRFDDNNIYKYRLKAIIRHQGSHTQGHYECFKRKPLFVKDLSGNILKLSPEINEALLDDSDEITSSNAPVSKVKTGSKGSMSSQGSDGSEERSGQFRNKISAMMGRRPSIVQADPDYANMQEIIDSGLATPAEVLIDDGDYFLGPTAEEIQNLLESIGQNQKNGSHRRHSKVKMKKIPSLIKHPYWRVGDSQVMEVTKSAVLFETASVYMLYYERIDRKQIER